MEGKWQWQWRIMANGTLASFPSPVSCLLFLPPVLSIALRLLCHAGCLSGCLSGCHSSSAQFSALSEPPSTLGADRTACLPASLPASLPVWLSASSCRGIPDLPFPCAQPHAQPHVPRVSAKSQPSLSQGSKRTCHACTFMHIDAYLQTQPAIKAHGVLLTYYLLTAINIINAPTLFTLFTIYKHCIY